jgi:very-short-patch-repair endonuclease
MQLLSVRILSEKFVGFLFNGIRLVGPNAVWKEREKMKENTKINWKMFKIEEPTTEYKFHPTRKWRFDFAWPDKLIALEVEGGVWSNGRHTRGSGFVKDMEKYNEAGKLGWRVFRFTPSEMKNNTALLFMRDMF